MFFVALDGDYPHAQVAVRDIVRAAVRWLTDPQWRGVEGVGVLGPVEVTNNEIAGMLSEALGKPIRFKALSKEENLKNLMQFGISEALANGVAEMYDAIGKGLFDAEARTPQTTTPTTLPEWLQAVFLPAMRRPTEPERG